jgi:hypothetical protein
MALVEKTTEMAAAGTPLAPLPAGAHLLLPLLEVSGGVSATSRGSARIRRPPPGPWRGSTDEGEDPGQPEQL